MAKAITLGCKAKDVISGFTGIVTSKHEHQNGMLQWGIQPAISKKDPHNFPDAISFDDNQLAYVGVGESARTVKSVHKLDFALGDEVEDIPSGYKGIAMVRSNWMNGCTHVSIQGKGEPAKDPLKRQAYPVQTIKKISDGLNKGKAALMPPAETKKPGGAPQRVERD